MAIGKDRMFGRQLRTLIHLGSVGELSDGQLLERFATSQGEAAELAFSALVERHGAMVLRVCRSILDDLHASDDAFQATFLVLVAKSRTLWVRDSLGPWLHQVAHRTARCARSNAARRKRLEKAASLVRSRSEIQPQPEPTGEIERALLEEIDRLPERFKAPVVLCDLEGQTHEAAARALGWPIGTVKSRQARARERLKGQLTRRGFAPTSSLALLALPRLAPSLTVALIQTTTTLAIRSAATRAILARGSAAWLAQEVLRSMVILRSAKIATLLIALGATGTGAGLIAQGPGEAARKPEAKAQAEPKAQVPEPAVDPSVYQVKPGKLEYTSDTGGTLEPWRSATLLSEIEGATTIVMIQPEGTKVSKGEIVAELDSALLRDNLVNQRISVQQAESAYNQAKLVREVAEYAVREYLEGVLPGDRASLKSSIASAEKAIREGEARLQRARAARKKLDDMFGANGPTTASDIVADLSLNALIETTEQGLANDKRGLETARKDLEVLEKFTQVKMTRKIQVDLEQARGDELNKLSRWKFEETKAKKLEHQIEKCTLRSPSDGMLVYAPRRLVGDRAVVIEEGATIRERQIICRIVDLNVPMQVSCEVYEPEINRIKIGQKARVTLHVLPDQIVTGTVVNIDPLPKGGSNPRTPSSYTAKIKLDQGHLNLRPNMGAEVKIIVQELDNALLVPSESVWVTLNRETGNKNMVTVKTPDGKFEAREITKGIDVDGFVEIKQGLKPGDLVVRNPIQ